MSDFSSGRFPSGNELRRDPRAEWIARNRLHPLHKDTLLAGNAEVRGPSGLLRKILMWSDLLGRMALNV